jgi:hypothetical protein
MGCFVLVSTTGAASMCDDLCCRDDVASASDASERACIPALELLLGSKRHCIRSACTRGMKRVDERQWWCESDADCVAVADALFWLMLGRTPYMPGSRSVSCGIVCSNGSRASGTQSAGKCSSITSLESISKDILREASVNQASLRFGA